MKDILLKKMRDAALYQVYVKGLEDGCFKSMCEAADYVIRQPAPRFYISAREASRRIGIILAGKELTGMSPPSFRRITLLYEKYLAYLDEYPNCPLSREAILEVLVQESAPEFYISSETARQALRREISKRRRKWAGY